MLQPINGRMRTANNSPVAPYGEYVLYWMTAFRRVSWNHSLDRAVDWASELGKPLLVLEALRCDYPWSSDRLHQFLVEGMADNARSLLRSRIAYYPYVEDSPGAGKGLLQSLASRACVVITDDYPAFFLPRMIAAAARKIPVLLEAVDSNGLIALSVHEKVYSSAHHFRRFVHGTLQETALDLPRQRPLAGRRLPVLGKLPTDILDKWQPADLLASKAGLALYGRLAIDRGVPPVPRRGGHRTAKKALTEFLENRLQSYGELRNLPETDATSGLSPYLHFGHLSVHEIAHEIIKRLEWSPTQIEPSAKGRRAGWWGLDESTEAFLDELVTWRELGFNAARHQPGFDSFASVPAWAKDTLESHRSDIREYVYAHEQFDGAETHDPIWNAAQRQLVREGRVHGYLRMLWGKKILEWSPTPQHAFDIMVELNNRYALDGRGPNSYSGILWVLGKYDRPWAPERPIFGRVRYMSSENTARKFRMKGYLQRYSA